MVSVTFVVCTSEPLVPVIVIAWAPVDAAAVVVHEKVDEPPAASGFGEKPKVTPPIAGAADSVTEPAKPLSAVLPTVKFAVPPAVIVCEPGDAESVKSDTGCALI